MRGLSTVRGLEIPFEPKTPVEGATLNDEDKASWSARRPSPGQTSLEIDIT
jgi:hypothetical protein